MLLAAERVDDIAIITDAVLTKGTTLLYAARYREGLVLLTGGLQLAEANGYVQSELRARLNISFLQEPDDRTHGRGDGRNRPRIGPAPWLWRAGRRCSPATSSGRSSPRATGARGSIAEELVPQTVDVAASELVGGWLVIRALRGGDASLMLDMDRLRAAMRARHGSQELTLVTQVELWLALADERLAEIQATTVAPGDPLNRLLTYRIMAHAAIWRRDAPGVRAICDAIVQTGLHGRWTGAILDGLRGRRRCTRRSRDCGGRGTVPRGHRPARRPGRRWTWPWRTSTGWPSRPTSQRPQRAAADARPIIDRLGAVVLARRLDTLLAEAAARAEAPARDHTVRWTQ